MAVILVSSCLLGYNCRYDGKNCKNDEILNLASNNVLIPICPEQSGGLQTPRLPSEINGNHVFMRDGTDVTTQYHNGALNALKTVKICSADFAILKAKSPSCGKGLIYDGTFTGAKVAGNGTTAQMLLDNGIRVFTEDELDILPLQK